MALVGMHSNVVLHERGIATTLRLVVVGFYCDKKEEALKRNNPFLAAALQIEGTYRIEKKK